MKIYDWHAAPNPRRLHIFLAEKGITVDLVEVDREHGRPAAWYVEKFPHALLPMLELDDGTCIGEVPAIWRYFETLQPEPRLLGIDAKDMALVTMWEALARDDGINRVAEVFRNTHPAFVDRALPGSAEPIPQLPELAQRGREGVARFFKKFDTQLATNTYVAGERYSVADITTLCVVDFAKRVGIEMPEDCVNLKRWHALVSARPSASA